jgi:uncharacterized FlgJ-related protein
MKKAMTIIVLFLFSFQQMSTGASIKISVEQKMDSWLKYNAPLNNETLELAVARIRVISPEVIVAQAKLETGHFSSELCVRYNNLFGMKMPRNRPTTAVAETINGYAIYRSWYESVEDMKLFQDYYRLKGRDLNDYSAFLSGVYAEDTLYLTKISKLCSTSR